MAAGDVVWFDQALVDMAKKLIDLSGDIRLGIVDATITPSATTAAPCWGAGGTTDFSAEQVSTGGTAYTGPIDLAGVTCTLSGGAMVFDADDVSISQDASGFTDGRWGILYDNAAANKNAIGYLDLGIARSIVTGPLSITWNASGILTLNQA